MEFYRTDRSSSVQHLIYLFRWVHKQTTDLTSQKKSIGHGQQKDSFLLKKAPYSTIFLQCFHATLLR